MKRTFSRAASPRLVGFLAPTCAVFLAAAAPLPLQAQDAPTCGWHFLDEQASPPTLDQLLQRTDGLSSRHQEAVAEIREWITACDHTAARRAAMSLRNERRRTNSTDPFLRALLGLALVRGPDVHVLHAEGALLRPVNRHTNAEIEGVRLLTAVAAETGWPEVVTELAAVAVATGKSESLATTVEALDRVPAAMRDASYWMALAEVELARENAPAARAAVEHVTDEEPRAQRALGIARMLSESDPAPGADIYLKGLARAAAGAALHRYFDDLRLLLSDAELAEWNALEDGHAQWIRRKWEWRALLSGIRVAERLAENQRRLAFALKNYRRTSYRGAPVPTTLWTDSLMPDPMLLDDRGMIYLRHGEPTHELRMVRNSSGPVEAQRIAWTYSRPGPVQPVFEFDRGPDRPDYFLAEPYPICRGQHVSTRQRIRFDSVSLGYPLPGDMVDWATRIHAFDPSLATYYRNCDRGPDVAQLAYQHLLTEARTHGGEMLNSENAAPRLRHPLTASMNLYAFAAAGATELVAYIGVHAGELSPAGSRVPLAYAFRILFAAGDPVTESIARRDTVIAFTQLAALPEDAIVGTAVPLKLQPADATRITLSIINGYDSQQGQVLATSRDIPSFSGSALGLSDIVIAQPRDGAWIRGASRLAPAQGHAFLEDSPFRLYYEIYNAAANDPLTVQIVVAPGRDEGLLAQLSSLISKRSALSIDFTEDAVVDPDGVVRTDREVGAELQPGSYVVMITVTNGRTGEVAKRETNLVIIEGS
ncbi:MAG TPA: hypothetical protein VK933_12500 [Longimicrobiales bacterium]|nr:hypothetical protein [Longimicrobiales bacterium]